MTEQLALPMTTPVPGWIDRVISFFGGEYWPQALNYSKARCVSKQQRPESYLRISTSPGSYGNIRIKGESLVTVETPHGRTEVEVSGELYELVKEGDVLFVSYQLSRLYAVNQNIRAQIAT